MSATAPMRSVWRTLVFTGLALGAFAANSVLCRMALGPREMSASAFTLIRLLSGAVVLVGLARVSGTRRGLGRAAAWRSPKTWTSAVALFTYAAGFSIAYLELDAGTGALLLFGAVQLTMIGAGVIAGERPRIGEWIGFAIALAGITYLLWPRDSGDSNFSSALLMVVAGAAWGLYSLRGRHEPAPIAANARHFGLATVPAAIVLALWPGESAAITQTGVLLAVASGALTSGLGYAIWYAALRGHTATSAAIVQLAVPVLAALGGAVFLAESLALRLAIATAGTLGGIAFALLAKHRATDASGTTDREHTR